VINALASDVAVTWLGAAGCLMCWFFLRNSDESGSRTRAAVFLIATLAVLLTVRGFAWLYPGTLGRLVFAAASLLPLAITLFTEHLLRRHHPLWLKVLAALATCVFFVLALATSLPDRPPLLLAFMTSLALVVAANGWFLARTRAEDLSRNELQLVRALLFAALLSVPLVITDFRGQLADLVPARLGALGALVLVYVLLSVIDRESVALALVRRLSAALLAAALLAVLFAAAMVPPGGDFLRVSLSGLPVALACMLLAAIIVRMLAISSANEGNRFLRWLLHARLDTAEHFLASLKHFSQTADYLILGTGQLGSYSLESLCALLESRREAVSIGEARAWMRSGDGRLDAAEQLVDLLERHEMTHALLVATHPLQIVLLNLPAGAHAAVGQLRASVIQRLARRLSDGAPAG
jgi:hypothetical protein